MNRIPLVLACWFAFWTGGGWFVGQWLQVPGVFTVGGFAIALLSIFAWPFIFPNRLLDWMED